MMKLHTPTSWQWVRVAQFLNRRIIHTSYLKGTIYFAIAVAFALAALYAASTLSIVSAP